MENAHQSRHRAQQLFTALVMGTVVALLYLIFEWVVNNGSDWIWNYLLQSNIYRWRVVPIALVMSLVLSSTVKLFNQKRVLPPETDLAGAGLNDIQATTLGKLAVIFIVGAISLLAGASLGPEASLVAMSLGLAAWLAGALKALKSPLAFTLTVTSLGALLCSFFYTLIPAVIPLLLLRKHKQLNAFTALVVLVSCVAAWAVVGVFKGSAYMTVPVAESFSISSIALALLLGFLSAVVGAGIHWLIRVFAGPTKALDGKYNWVITALVFGLVLGALYLIGGQTVQFSGSEGLKLLSQNAKSYGALALLGLAAVKMLSTSWSLASGYRGGLVFPSIYTGVALSLAISAAFHLSGLNEAGTTIGATSGILVSMTNPLLGIVLSFSLFPASLLPVVIAGVAGAFAGHWAFAMAMPPK